MRRLTVLILLCLLPALVPAAEGGAANFGRPSGIKGVDDRMGTAANEAPWAAVGRINNRQGSFCTGTLIGPKLVLTAAHCIWNRKTQDWLPVQALTFVAGYSRGRWLADSEVAGYLISPKYKKMRENSVSNAANDWALVELKSDLGSKVGYFGLAALGSDKYKPARRYIQVGYSQDREHIQTAHLACNFTHVDTAGLARHECDAMHGDSGSPIFHWLGSYQIVAIHVSTITQSDGTVVGGAVPTGMFYDQAMKMGASKNGKTGGSMIENGPVRSIQLLLPRFLLEPGNYEGRLDDTTRQAIRTWQARAPVPVDGEPTTELLGNMLMVLR